MRGLALACLAVVVLASPLLAEELPEIAKQWDWKDLAKTEKRFRDLAAKAKKAKDLDYELQALTQAARAIWLQKRFDEALAILDDVEKRLTEDTKLARIRNLLERGRTYNDSGKKKDAKKLFIEAFELAKKVGDDPLAVDAAHMVGIVVPTEEQLGWHLRALDLVTRSKDERVKGWFGTLYHNIGMTYLDQGKLEYALDYLMKDYEHRLKTAKDSNSIRIAKWCVAHVLRKMERYEPAMRMQKEMEKECAETGAPDGFVCEEIAEIYWSRGKKEAVRPYFKRAYEILKDIGWVKSDTARVDRLKRLAEGKEE
ncbi:MAG: tetratricopeptide repeat protein [Planctomycetota bacterium]